MFGLRCAGVRRSPFSAADEHGQYGHGLDDGAILGAGLQQPSDAVRLRRIEQHAAHGQQEHGGRQRRQQAVVARQRAPLHAAERQPAADGQRAHRQPGVQPRRAGRRHGPGAAVGPTACQNDKGRVREEVGVLADRTHHTWNGNRIIPCSILGDGGVLRTLTHAIFV